MDRGMCLAALQKFMSQRRTLRSPIAVDPARVSCLTASVICVLLSLIVSAQEAAPRDPQPASDTDDKRILWIIPNYRTSPSLTPYQPLTPRQKFGIAVDDSFDRGTMVLALLFAGKDQLGDAAPSYGHGVPAYLRYSAAAYGDLVIGNFMTEAIYPTLVRQDPRYFRRATGSGWSRVGYAIGQILWTHSDAAGMQFNLSEVAGNATAVGLSNTYDPDNRRPSRNLSKFGLQIGVDMAANILKEFWPDLHQAFARTDRSDPASRLAEGRGIAREVEPVARP